MLVGFIAPNSEYKKRSLNILLVSKFLRIGSAWEFSAVIVLVLLLLCWLLCELEHSCYGADKTLEVIIIVV